MDCEDYKYFGFYQYYLGEFEEVWDDPEDPILTCIRHEFHFLVDPYYIIIIPNGNQKFAYKVQNEYETIFDSQNYLGNPSYNNVSSMIEYYHALQNGEDTSSILPNLYAPHARLLKGEKPQKKLDILTLSSFDDLQEAVNALAEEMGISFDSTEPSDPQDD